MMERRTFLAILAAAMAGSPLVRPVLAKDGEDDDDSSGSGSSGSGSGSGGDRDDDDDDDRDDDRGRDRADEPDDKRDDDDEDPRKAVERGDAIPLKDALSRLKAARDGRVIDAELRQKGSRLIYEFKMVDARGVVRKVEMDARTGRLRGLFGF